MPLMAAGAPCPASKKPEVAWRQGLARRKAAARNRIINISISNSSFKDCRWPGVSCFSATVYLHNLRIRDKQKIV